VRRTAAIKDKENSVSSGSTAYAMSENERKEHCYGSWLYVTAPEVLLGETLYTWRSDIWSAGCVVLAILLDRVPFLQGQDVRVQLDLIFRMCGTPNSSWEEGTKLRLYRAFKPKHDYKMRVRKTMVEQKKKFPEFPEEAIDVLEAVLQLDPSKRISAKKVLDLTFFDDVRREEEAAAGTELAFDFSTLSSTFPMQKKKLLQHLKSKRRYPSSGSSSSHRTKPSKSGSSAGNGGGSGSSSEKAGHRHRYKRALSMDKEGGETSDRSARRAKKRGKDNDVEMAGGDDDVPLPASFQFSALSVKEDNNSRGSGGERAGSSSVPPKREMLGWGMGLSSQQDELAKGG
jgi:serine/threonine protein kinase